MFTRLSHFGFDSSVKHFSPPAVLQNFCLPYACQQHLQKNPAERVFYTYIYVIVPFECIQL